MLQPTLIDVAIALAILGSVLSACHRGLAREMLHTVMFAILVAVGYVLFRNKALEASSPDDVIFWLVNSMYYLVTAYVLTWVAMKVLSPLIIGREAIGMRSRLWAGILSLAKLASVVFGLNLWFAVNNTEAHPARLESLPTILRESALVHLSDRYTEDLHVWLAENNLMEYKKTTYRKEEPKDQRRKELEELLGVPPTE
ncbi:MAG: CvpA family protein [Alphaproteobacteria bacterium]|nr:MAG: CvpA family protein [Alphaproteobacteria bacterium]